MDVVPRKPRSAYFLFANDARSQIKTENPDASITQVAKLIGERWKIMSADEKQPYEEAAASEKSAYAAAVAAGLVKAPEPANGDSEDKQTPTILPISRIKKLVKTDPEVGTVNKDASFLLTAALELFLQLLADESGAVVSSAGRKTVTHVDVARAIQRNDALWFLQPDFPVPTKEQLEAQRAAKAAARAAALAGGHAGEGAGAGAGGAEGEAPGLGAQQEGEGDAAMAGGAAAVKSKGRLESLFEKAAAIAAANPRPPRPVPQPQSDVVDVDGEEAADGHGGASGSARKPGSGKKPDGAGSRSGSKGAKGGKGAAKGAAKARPAALDGFVVKLDTAEQAHAMWAQQFANSVLPDIEPPPPRKRRQSKGAGSSSSSRKRSGSRGAGGNDDGAEQIDSDDGEGEGDGGDGGDGGSIDLSAIRRRSGLKAKRKAKSKEGGAKGTKAGKPKVSANGKSMKRSSGGAAVDLAGDSDGEGEGDDREGEGGGEAEAEDIDDDNLELRAEAEAEQEAEEDDGPAVRRARSSSHRSSSGGGDGGSGGNESRRLHRSGGVAAEEQEDEEDEEEFHLWQDEPASQKADKARQKLPAYIEKNLDNVAVALSEEAEGGEEDGAGAGGSGGAASSRKRARVQSGATV